MQNFNDLQVYKKAYELSRQVWDDIKDNSNARLKSQLFGSITSIPAHLAELCAYDSKKEKEVRIRRAIGEANEAEYWLNFCKDTGELPAHKCDVFIKLLTEVRKMLFGLLKSIKEDEKHE